MVIVMVHWGVEYTSTPSKQQKEVAQYLTDLGVDVVIGNHPHVIQPIEWKQNKDGHETLIYYSSWKSYFCARKTRNIGWRIILCTIC